MTTHRNNMVVHEIDYDFLKSTFDDSLSDIRPKGLKGAFHSVAEFCQQGLDKVKNARHVAPIEIEVRREDFFFDRDEYVPEYQHEDEEEPAFVTVEESHQKSLRGKFLALTHLCPQGMSKTSKDNDDILPPPPPPSDRWDDTVTRTLPSGTQIRIAHAFKTANGRIATNEVFVLPRDPDYIMHYIRGQY